MTLLQLYELPNEVVKLVDTDEPCDLDAIRAGYEAWLAEVADAERREAMEKDLLRFGKAWLALDAEVEMLEKHRDATNARIKSKSDRAEWLKSWMLNLMLQTGIDKVKDPLVSVYTQKNNTSVDVEDIDAVPVEWKRATLTLPLADVPLLLRGKATIEVRKSDLLAYVKETGEVIPGVIIIDNRKHVRVR